jgi:ATP-binding cassette, subfamily B, bacterial MsbA
MRTFWRLLPYARPYRARFIQAFFVMAGVAALNGATVWIVKPAINHVFAQADAGMLWTVVSLIPAIFFLKLVFGYAQTYLMSWLSQRITQNLREDLFRHLHELSMEFYWRSKAGDVLSRMTNDMTRLQDGLQFVPLYIVRDTLTVTVLLGVMFYLHWQFALTALIAIPLAGGVLGVLGKKLRSAGRRSHEIMGEIYHRFQESLQSMLVVKAFNYEAGAIAKFKQENDSLFHQMMRYFRATALSGPLMEFLGSLIMAAIVYQGGREIIDKRMTPGEFFAFLASFFAAYGPIKNLSQLNATLQLSLASADRIFAILDEKPSVVEKRGAAELKDIANAIQLQDVSFRYPGRDDWALRGVNLTIKRGEVVAVAGLRIFAILRCRRSASAWAWSLKRPCSLTTRWPATSLWASPPLPSQTSGGRSTSRTPRRSSPKCPKAWRRRSAIAAPAYRGGSGSGLRSRARCLRTRRS